MPPGRSPKRQKTSQASGEPPEPALSSQEATQPAIPQSDTLSPADGSTPRHQSSSWYNSWSRKAPPVTQVARESIASASNTATEALSNITLSSSPKPRSIRSPSLAMTLGKDKTTRGLPISATTTAVHAEANTPSRKTSTKAAQPEADEAKELDRSKSETPRNHSQEGISAAQSEPSPKTEVKDDQAQAGSEGLPQNNRASWLAWLGRSEATPSKALGGDVNPAGTEIAQGETKPTPIEDKTAGTESYSEQTNATAHEIATTADKQSANRASTTRTSWLSWSSAPATSTDALPSAVGQSEALKSEPGAEIRSRPLSIARQEASKPQSVASSEEPAPPPSLPHDGTKPSAWVFWSKDRKVNDSSASIDQPRHGDIAISDTPSQARPKRTSISLQESSDKAKIDKSHQDMERKHDTAGSASKKAADSLPQSTTGIATSKIEGKSATATAQEPAENKKPASIRSSKVYQSLLLPSLHATLKLPENPSILQQITRWLSLTKESELRHLALVKEPPRIKNALAIGVHGFFPAALLRTVLGQPTGTSIKFADMAAKAIKRWTAARGYECSVKTAALEGEGKIAERIDLLWKLLLNWIEEIRKADFVLVACHSQGVPVAVMLVAKLIQFGCLNAAKIGICAMAGVNLGPFSDYKSRFISGSAGELFEFTDPSSRVSKDYLTGLETVLSFGVKITFVGSIDDQLVSLESSINSPISHPHIFRAVSIDARAHAPNFLSHLVGFALKLRNLGVQDHGLIRELSPPLAGSLYTGEGHSRIYEDDAVYDLAVAFTLETTTKAHMPISQRTIGGTTAAAANTTTMSTAAAPANPYILPFAMRGMLEEDFVRNELQDEATELLRQFDDWKPTTKVLKDVKFRLEGIRSKL